MEQFKEVFFDEYCPKCKHSDRAEEDNPCFDCLDYPVNSYSHKPVNFEEEKS